MAGEYSVGELPIPPGFDNLPLPKTEPSTIDGSVKRGPGRPPKQRSVSAEDEQDQGHDNSTTRRSLRTRTSPDLVAPYHSPRSSVHCDATSQPVKRGRGRGRGRPWRRRPVSSDEISDVHDQGRDNSKRRSLRRRDLPDFIAPYHSSPSLDLCDATSQPVKRGRPRRQRPVSSDVTEIPTVTPPTVPPPRSSMDTPKLIPSDEKHRETEIKMDPLSLLIQPPKPRLGEECSPHFDGETMTNAVTQAKSALVTLLGITKDVEKMVVFANNTFQNLDLLHVDYTSFYNVVKDFIACHRDLDNLKTQRDNQPLLELKAKAENAKTRAEKLKDEIDHMQRHLEKIMTQKEPLEAQIREAEELICRLKQKVESFETVEEGLKLKKEKCITDLQLSEQEAQILGSQVEATEKVLRDIDHLKKAVLNDIESTNLRFRDFS